MLGKSLLLIFRVALMMRYPRDIAGGAHHYGMLEINRDWVHSTVLVTGPTIKLKKKLNTN